MTYDIVYNIAKGRVAELSKLAATNDALIAVPLEAASIVDAATMVDYDTLDAILSGTSNEHSMGRKTLSSAVVTTDDTNNWTQVDADDILWTGVSGTDTAALVICYDPDTTGGTDADLIPLVCLDMVASPSGGDIEFQFHINGFYKAS